MGKIVKTLVKSEQPLYSSETVVNDKGDKFKIVAENGNCYSHLRIYIYTKNGDTCMVANEYDIPVYNEVKYYHSDEERLDGNRANLVAAEAYIENVW